MLDFLPKGIQEAKVDHLVLGSGTAVITAIPTQEINAGLVLVPDVFGLRDLVEQTVQVLAENGIATIAVEPFSHMSENPSQLSREEKLSRMRFQDDNLQCADILAAGQILRTEHGCERVGLIGFCIGGMYAFKCSGTGWFDSVVSCYGMISIPQDWQGQGQREPLDFLQMPTASPTLAIIGGQDHGFAKPDDVHDLQTVLEQFHHKELGSKVLIYPEAGHAFMHDPNREEYRPEDAKDAWTHALNFLEVRPSLKD